MRVLLKTIDQPNLTKSEQYLQRLAFLEHLLLSVNI